MSIVVYTIMRDYPVFIGFKGLVRTDFLAECNIVYLK